MMGICAGPLVRACESSPLCVAVIVFSVEKNLEVDHGSRRTGSLQGTPFVISPQDGHLPRQGTKWAIACPTLRHRRKHDDVCAFFLTRARPLELMMYAFHHAQPLFPILSRESDAIRNRNEVLSCKPTDNWGGGAPRLTVLGALNPEQAASGRIDLPMSANGLRFSWARKM